VHGARQPAHRDVRDRRARDPQSAAITPVGSRTSPLGRTISATPAMPHAMATAVGQPIGSASSNHASTPVSSGVEFCSTVASASGSRSSAM